MKKSKLLTAMVMLWALISCVEIRAQEIQKVSNDSIALQEVVVKAARVVNKEDGKLIFPSDIQKQRSFSGFSLLGRPLLFGLNFSFSTFTGFSLSGIFVASLAL